MKHKENNDTHFFKDSYVRRFLVEVTDMDENPHRLWAREEVQKDKWYTVEALSQYNEKKKTSTVTLTVDGVAASHSYPGKALRHNATTWVEGRCS